MSRSSRGIKTQKNETNPEYIECKGLNVTNLLLQIDGKTKTERNSKNTEIGKW